MGNGRSSSQTYTNRASPYPGANTNGRRVAPLYAPSYPHNMPNNQRGPNVPHNRPPTATNQNQMSNSYSSYPRQQQNPYAPGMYAQYPGQPYASQAQGAYPGQTQNNFGPNYATNAPPVATVPQYFNVWMAVESGNISSLDNWLAAGNPVDIASPANGHTPLHCAAKVGNYDITMRLIKGNANVNARAKDGATPLILAIRYKHDNIVRLLGEHGAKVNMKDAQGHDALWWINVTGQDNLAEFLKDIMLIQQHAVMSKSPNLSASPPVHTFLPNALNVLSSSPSGKKIGSEDVEDKNKSDETPEEDNEEGEKHQPKKKGSAKKEELSEKQRRDIAIKWLATFMDEDFTCPICLELLYKPITVVCGHTFCRQCLDSCWAGEKVACICPLCRAPSGVQTTKKLSDNFILSTILQKIVPEEYTRRAKQCDPSVT